MVVRLSLPPVLRAENGFGVIDVVEQGGTVERSVLLVYHKRA